MRPGVLLVPLLAAAQSSPPSIDTLQWISGVWQGDWNRGEIEEHWTPPKGRAMLGVNRIVAGGRMVMFEYLRIEQRPEGIFYIAQPRGRPPVEFPLTGWSEREAVFENPKHDYPQKILYRLEPDGSLTARIEGDRQGKKPAQEFRFRRSK